MPHWMGASASHSGGGGTVACSTSDPLSRVGFAQPAIEGGVAAPGIVESLASDTVTRLSGRTA